MGLFRQVVHESMPDGVCESLDLQLRAREEGEAEERRCVYIGFESMLQSTCTNSKLT